MNPSLGNALWDVAAVADRLLALLGLNWETREVAGAGLWRCRIRDLLDYDPAACWGELTMWAIGSKDSLLGCRLRPPQEPRCVRMWRETGEAWPGYCNKCWQLGRIPEVTEGAEA